MNQENKATARMTQQNMFEHKHVASTTGPLQYQSHP
jgi:hypothetical protein